MDFINRPADVMEQQVTLFHGTPMYMLMSVLRHGLPFCTVNNPELSFAEKDSENGIWAMRGQTPDCVESYFVLTPLSEASAWAAVLEISTDADRVISGKGRQNQKRLDPRKSFLKAVHIRGERMKDIVCSTRCYAQPRWIGGLEVPPHAHAVTMMEEMERKFLNKARLQPFERSLVRPPWPTEPLPGSATSWFQEI
jgi:hypothetical protein